MHQYGVLHTSKFPQRFLLEAGPIKGKLFEKNKQVFRTHPRGNETCHIKFVDQGRLAQSQQ